MFIVFWKYRMCFLVSQAHKWKEILPQGGPIPRVPSIPDLDNLDETWGSGTGKIEVRFWT